MKRRAPTNYIDSPYLRDGARRNTRVWYCRKDRVWFAIDRRHKHSLLDAGSASEALRERVLLSQTMQSFKQNALRRRKFRAWTIAAIAGAC